MFYKKNHGFNLIRTGTKPLKSYPNKRFWMICSRCQVYRDDKGSRERLNFVDTSYSNQFKNRRNKNQVGSMCRRMKTKLSSSKDELCSFHFYISYDDFRFFVVNSRGNHCHSNHAPFPKNNNLTPARLIRRNHLKVVQDLCSAHASLGVMRNHIHLKTGTDYSLAHLCHIRNVCGILKN